jgi:hypothetical protein
MTYTYTVQFRRDAHPLLPGHRPQQRRYRQASGIIRVVHGEVYEVGLGALITKTAKQQRTFIGSFG